MPQVYAVMREGNVVINREGDGVVVCTSYWMTESEAQAAIDRQFNNFGSWRPKRSWVKRVNLDKREMWKVSELNNGVEPVKRIDYCV